MNDPELELIFQELRKAAPTARQVARWKQAVRAEVRPESRSNRTPWIQLLAASVAGFVIALAIFGPGITKPASSLAQEDRSNATIEYILTKTD